MIMKNDYLFPWYRTDFRARFARWLAAPLVMLSLCAGAALAQSDFPNKPIRMIVPNPPGGVTNLIGRVIGDEWRAKYGQPVVIENKPGGNGSIGSIFVAKSPPDGYTVLFHGPTITVEQNLHTNGIFDVRRDLIPVGPAVQGTFGLHVSNNLPVNSVQEFIRYAKQNPGKLNYGSAGTGTFTHLMSESLFQALGIKLEHIPFQGGGPLLLGVLGGQVDVMLGDVSQTRQQVSAGKMKLLAVLAYERSPLAPNVPTIEEAGGPKFEAPFTNGFFVPAGTPPEIVTRLNQMIRETVERPDVKKKFLELGYLSKTSSPQEYKAVIDREVDRMGKLVNALGLAKAD
jgi:tripartite-type tricarboxylate transporter receptor subunit TctC